MGLLPGRLDAGGDEAPALPATGSELFPTEREVDRMCMYERALAAADLRLFPRLPKGKGDDNDAVTMAVADTVRLLKLWNGRFGGIYDLAPATADRMVLPIPPKGESRDEGTLTGAAVYPV